MEEISKEKRIEILTKKIFDYMRNLPSNLPAPVIAFNIECDSNLTDFEDQSNRLKIGVVTQSEELIPLLSLFLRMIVDHNNNYLEYMVGDFLYDKQYEEENLNDKNVFRELIKFLSRGEYSKFELNSKFESRLRGKWDNSKNKCDTIIITTTIIDVDIWTLPRIENEIAEMLYYN